MIVYTRENGYGSIDIDSEPFQLGQRLYEAQVIYNDLEHGKTIDAKRIEELVRWYCQLVNWMGQLRADYRCMVEVAEGKAEFREK